MSINLSVSGSPVVRTSDGVIVGLHSTSNNVQYFGTSNNNIGITALWENAGVYEGKQISLRATVLSIGEPNDIVTFGTSGDDFNILIKSQSLASNQNSSATIKWEIIDTATQKVISGDVGLQIGDIDGLDGQAHTRETVSASQDSLTSFVTNNTTSIQIDTSNNSVDASGTQDNNEPTAPASSYVGFNFSSANSFVLTYSLAANSFTSQALFSHDGDFDITISDPKTTYTPRIDLDADNSSGATENAFATHYAQGSAGVAILDADASLAGPSSFTSASITLTNRMPGDRLNLPTLPAGFSATTDTSSSDKIVLTLSGTGSAETYRSLLLGITFANSADEPNTEPRLIDISLSDGTIHGNVATTTLAVIPTRTIDLGTLAPEEGATITGAAAGDYAGYSVSSAGDVNGDGIDDILVGAPNNHASENGSSDPGNAYVIFGREGGLGTIDLAAFDDDDASNDPGIKITGAHNADFAGWSVSKAGDVNGDGVADFIVGVPYSDVGTAADDNGGNAYVIFGKTDAAGGLGPIDLSVFDGDTPVNSTGIKISGVSGSLAGVSVSNAGDVNGDGVDDLLVGANNSDPNDNSNAGNTYVIFGTTQEAGGLGNIDLAMFEDEDSSNDPGIKISGAGADNFSGYTVSAAGDVNGDGVDDLILGAPQATIGTNGYAGASYLIYGKKVADGGLASIELSAFDDDDLTNDPGFKISGGEAFSFSGYSVSGAGDVNGDGVADLIVGSNWASALGRAQSGTAYVIYGKVGGVGNIDLSGLSLNQGFTISGAAAQAFTGVSVSDAGDVNGDGYDDVIVGAFYEGTGGTQAGASYVVFGKADGPGNIDLAALNRSQGFKINGAQPGDQSGYAVSAAGDVNGDGFADVIVGAYGADTAGKTDTGAAYVVYGGATSGSPDIVSVSSTAANGRYDVGATISIIVTFANPVDIIHINATGGPRILLETGESDHYATYTSGSGTASLIFTYTVVSGDVSADLSYAGPNALDLNGARIVSVTTGTDVTVVLPVPGATGSLSASSDIALGPDPVPVVTLPDASAGAIDYDEQADAVSVFGGLDLSDGDGTSLASATILFANFQVGEDTLALAASSGIGNIASSFDAATGKLTLTSEGSSASLAEWQTALRSIAFENSSDNPDVTQRTLSLVVSDGTHESSALVRQIDVHAVNDLPVAGNDSFSIDEDTATTFDVLVNDSDVDGTRLTIRAINGVAVKAEAKEEKRFAEAVAEASTSASAAQIFSVDHGTVQINSDGGLKFTPDSDFTGTTSFTYTVSDERGGAQTATVTVNVLPVNDAPVAGNYEYAAQEDEALVLDVVAQSTDADGDALQISAVDGKILTADGVQVTGGLVTLNDQGALLFTPTANYNGPVNFTYTLSDGNGGLGDGRVDITVQPVNDLPIIGADKFTVTERETVVLNLLANDSDPENDALKITSINGKPVAAAGTTASFNMAVVGGSISLGNDGKLTFTAAANYGGNVAFTYTVSDGRGTSTGTVTGTVVSVNEAPDAGNDTFSVAEDGISTLPVLSNDKDVDGDVLRVVAIDGQPLTTTVGSNGIVSTTPVNVANGSVVVNGNGSVVFTPKPNFNGATSFTYTVSDGQGGTDTATVNLNVIPMNDAPAAANDSFTVAADVGTTLNLLANDSDIDGDTLRIVAINGVQINPDQGEAAVKAKSREAVASTSTSADDTASTGSASTPTTTTPVSSTQATTIKIADGTLVLNADGTVLFTPNAHFSGKTSFTYTVSDGHNGTSTATAVIDVAPAIATPVATVDTFTVAEDGVVVLDLLSNDTGDGALSLVEINGIAWKEGAQAALAGGIVSRSTNGALQFQATANFSGDVAFTYGIVDSHGTRATGRVSGTVTPVNDAPTASDVSFAVATGIKSQRIDVGAGTKDIDGDLVRVLAVDGKVITASAPVALASGMVSLAADGNLIFSPLATFSGTASFAYTLTDNQGGTHSAQVTGEVQAVESWASFGTQLDLVLGDLGLSKPSNLNDLLAKATYLAPAAFATAGAGAGQVPMGGYHAAAGYDLDLNTATPDAGALSKALAALINGQTYFNTPSVAKMDEKGAVTSAVDQSLLFQSYLKSSAEVQVDDGSGVQNFAAIASAEHAWSKAFAQSVLSAGFAADQVTKYDHQSQAKLHQTIVERDAALTVKLDGVATIASKAAIDSKAAEFVSDDGASAVEIARPVAVAETAGAADDQNAVVRMRQVGANDSSVMFYKVDDFAGTVNGLKPGDAGYDAATNAHAYQTDTGSTWVSGSGYGKYSEATLTHINANDLIAMKLSSGGSTFYAFADANEIVGGQHVAHLWSYGLNTWGWEDLYGGGDSDFNDMVVQLDFLAVKTSQDQIL
ncbi:Ig-like domain-containing protein [Xanthobacter sp. VTT E-85241]|uniref:tandem-95 repeat protein n=1 Tax=Roseixanthobacter finlandensis TaxID=3119922 RepID=UPI0037271209